MGTLPPQLLQGDPCGMQQQALGRSLRQCWWDLSGGLASEPEPGRSCRDLWFDLELPAPAERGPAELPAACLRTCIYDWVHGLPLQGQALRGTGGASGTFETGENKESAPLVRGARKSTQWPSRDVLW